MNTGKAYNTKQQQAILDCMKENKEEYVQISEILEKLELEGIHVGIATAYRKLDKLVQERKVRKIKVDGIAGACYQLVPEKRVEGFSLICEKCNRIMDAECDHVYRFYKHIMEDHDFVINPDKTVFYGICEKCKLQNK
jgi:Fur family transcriptional regulator, ferric uptake regulator